ncbi:MAG: lipoate--protein ligase family protein [Planctomycetia bacterium]|nr:lipoate--protein ligase family protein [Planctomycetia bacterium]
MPILSFSGPLRLLFDPPADGAWNMALDELLLDEAATTGQATLRFYAWSEPTLSLGYFQNAGDRAAHAASLNCPLVRRASGGGAIVHDAELTYSLALPERADAGVPAGNAALYDLLHETLIAALREWNVTASRLVKAAGALPQAPGSGAAEPFLCFMRRAAGDVLCDGAKVGGSAQRRRRGAVLQHGSVLLRASAAAPELAGLAELCGVEIDRGGLAEAWAGGLLKQGLGPMQHTPLSSEMLSAAMSLSQAKYRSAAWNERRL